MTSISVLSSDLRGWYGNSFFWGIVRRAREESVDVIWFPGGRLSQAEKGVGGLYDLASRVKTHGVILVGDLALGSTSETIRGFCGSFAPTPVVGGVVDADGVPVVLPDSKEGMFQLVSHLIETHTFRHIAFICGPSGQLESSERFEAYKKAVTTHGLSIDPELIVPGDYLEESGRAAVRLLLDERRVRPDAIVAANDSMALGALAEFRSRGIRVPEDIALAGFDDIEAGRLALTPLTTVRQHFYEAGYRTADTLLERIRGNGPEGKILVPTEVVIRSSCGCLPSEVDDAQLEEGAESSLIPIEEIRENLPVLVSSILEAALKTGRASHSNAFGVPPQIPSEQTLLDVTEALFAELVDGKAHHFLPVLRKAVQPERVEVEETAIWQNTLSALRSGLLSRLGDHKLAFKAENLFQKARILLAETGLRVLTYRRTVVEQYERALQDLDQALNGILDLEEMPPLLARFLPALGITACYVVMYEGAGHLDASESSPKSAKLVFSYSEGTFKASPPQSFRPSEFIPAAAATCKKPAILIVEPLVQSTKPLGYMLVEASHSEFEVYAQLRNLVSGALFRTLLLAQREEASRELKELQAEAQRWAEDIEELTAKEEPAERR
ncbi:MAG: substrate-binding domain-containing protein [Acidobacteria bacterium]|nr:substrate-binding domain-containing protein [Acidobacteriota bacterium]